MIFSNLSNRRRNELQYPGKLLGQAHLDSSPTTVYAASTSVYAEDVSIYLTNISSAQTHCDVFVYDSGQGEVATLTTELLSGIGVAKVTDAKSDDSKSFWVFGGIKLGPEQVIAGRDTSNFIVMTVFGREIDRS